MAVERTRGGRPSKRTDILMAAELLVKQHGAGQLTFDRLSEETGISKGGLLYHFASKEDLVLAMMERLLDARERLREELEHEFSGPDADIKALLMAEANVRSITATKCGEGYDELAMDSAILCAASNNPELLAPMRGRFADLMQRFDSSTMGGDKARIAFFAILGERLMQQLGMVQNNSEQRDQFLNAIRDFIR